MKKVGFVLLLALMMGVILMPENVDAYDMKNEVDGKRVVYLTFDDGPTIYTREILEILKAHEAYGIFFVLGSQMHYMPESSEILKEIVDREHYIGLHSMTHDQKGLYWEEYSPSRFVNEMMELKGKLNATLGWDTVLCRAPYGKNGHFKPAHHKAVEDAGLYCIDWHVDSKDWKLTSADAIYERVMREIAEIPETQQEIVILMHELRQTAEALPRILESLKEAGFRVGQYQKGHVFEGL